MAQIDPEHINEWLGVGGAIAAGLAWFYRHAIVGGWRWIKNLFSIPSRVEEMSRAITEINMHTQITLALARASWDTLTIPVWHSDPFGKCVHINLAFRTLIECQPSEILGDGWRTIIHQDDKSMVFAEWDSCVAQRRDFDLQYRWRTRSGTVHNVHARATRITLPDGTLAGWVAFVEVLPTPTQGATP